MWIIAIFVVITVLVLGVPSCSRRSEVSGKSEAPQRNSSGGAPRAVVDATEHDFGVVQPTGKCEFTFALSNAGDKPLQIHKVHKSCNCVLDKLPLRVLLPGQSAPLRVVVQLKGRQGPFEDTIEIQTNDPDREMLQLMLRGRAAWLLATDPPRLNWHDLDHRETRKAEILLYSQVWDQFDVTRVTASSEAVRYELTPATSEQLAQVDAKSGYVARVTLQPAELEHETLRVNETLQFTASRDSDAAERQSACLTIAGSLKKRVSIHGTGLTAANALSIGTLSPGEGAHRRLTMKVNARRRKIAVRRIETYPDYLRVAVRPLASGSDRAGLYCIDVNVPADAPPGNHLQKNRAWLRIITDNPEVPEIQLPVEFAVLSP